MPRKQTPGNKGYRDAMAKLISRIEPLLEGVPKEKLPLRIFIAGGAAYFLHTGTRVSHDVDASLSLRLHLPENLVETYVDDQGHPASVHLDRSYNDTLGPMHEDAFRDAQPVAMKGVNRRKIDIRVLTPVDLAVSKLGRFSELDRADIAGLARSGQLDPVSLKRRAEQAMSYYVGNVSALRANLRDALALVRAAATAPPVIPAKAGIQ